MSAEEDMDVPPLEDMSELIKQVDSLRELKKQQQGVTTSQNGHATSSKAEETQPNCLQKKTILDFPSPSVSTEIKSKLSESAQVAARTDNTPPANEKPKNSSFGGMKKGFLFGCSSKPKAVPKNTVVVKNSTDSANKTDSKTNKTLEDIPFIKKNEEAGGEGLRFSEVQEAMEKTNAKLMENKDWVTDDLLTKLEKNEKLTKRLQDPTFVQAIGEFQKNPQEAMQKYGNNKEVQEFFQDFCGLMGDHFNKLGDQQNAPTENKRSTSSESKVTTVSPTGGADMSVRSSTNPNQPTAADEAQMQQILSDPDIRLILMDPKIQDLFQHLRNDPAKAHRTMQQADRELGQKIQKLVSVGLLQFQK